jgi:thymidylate synthase
MQQYIDLCKRVLTEGIWVTNERTGARCLTVINADLEYDVSDGTVPVLTTKKVSWKSAIAEMMGYLRGYSSAAQFRELGCKTWDANANDNEHWLNNPFRKGADDMGRAYGVQGRSWRNPEGVELDQLRKIVDHLSAGKDDRREILTFWNPGEMDRMCLPACMHTHTFSVLDGSLYLTSYQRSGDLPLGVPFNMIQVAWLLLVMARITGLKPGRAYHKIVNVHVYENQVDLLKSQIDREPFESPCLIMDDRIQSFRDIECRVRPEHFDLSGYVHHPAIKFPFTV